uniref:Uncharacterized protein n=1 Tax=Panagrolaimus sp. PS1159 TaxID=55785 RepID=A0AC35FU19_9BILA
MDRDRHNRNQSRRSNDHRNNTGHNNGSSSTNNVKKSSLFLNLKDYYDIPRSKHSTLSIDEICECLDLEMYEAIVLRALSSLYQHRATNPKLFYDDEFTDRIIPLIGDLFNWTSDVEDAFIFHLNKIFDIIFQLPTTKMWTFFDKLCDYILNGLKNEHSEFKILSLHILQTHIFSRCPATMNKNLYYKYLDFLSKDCIEGNVLFEAALITLVHFLDVYICNNSPKPDNEIRDGQTTYSSQTGMCGNEIS